ncbi:hypothetical protein B0181_08490 [Moraxella caviae]|uniref:Uncharacterized protein n=1 Tax=Moraxella caviae TaxID=34060 RepID=A0A1S9ZXW3_9GAMM|nr:hypothetical protein [Moraxella caviae]OOR88269.1 hypothetical protein B0181_08490 [Moraxella caviae]
MTKRHIAMPKRHRACSAFDVHFPAANKPLPIPLPTNSSIASLCKIVQIRSNAKRERWVIFILPMVYTLMMR